MKIGPKFKIAKRLGAPVFEKTQSSKFALSEARPGRPRKRVSQSSDFKKQLIEKQKMRYIYGLTEKQLARYVKSSMTKEHQPITLLLNRLETRLDNVVYRLGLARTRRFARQMVSHGHILVNGKKLNIPSHQVQVGDIISIREGSKQTNLFVTLADTHESASVPSWLSFDLKKMEGSVAGMPVHEAANFMFDAEQVLEYYSR